MLLTNKICVSFHHLQQTSRTAAQAPSPGTFCTPMNRGTWSLLTCPNEIKNADDMKCTMLRNRLLEWFQGDFDNYRQVVDDRKDGLLPREGGGHEHFHCTLVPVTESSRLAAFFFDGNPERIFRFRYYELLLDPEDDSDDNNNSVEMKLNTLHPELEKLLKIHSNDPLSWPRLFNEFEPTDAAEEKVVLLPKCEISWSMDKDPELHSYALDIPEETSKIDGHDEDSNDLGGSLHAVMVHGEALVNSTIVPGMMIRILDQLSLYPEAFYINDRGFDPKSGSFIYGNQKGVPYRLERVTNFLPLANNNVDKKLSLERHVINRDLAWTLGPEWRTEDEYDKKLNVIGGPSAGINKKSYKSKFSITKD
jgi:hypothetical protein